MERSRQFDFVPAENFVHGHKVVAKDGDAEVGRMEWHPKSGEIREVYVAPEHRRQGVATDMYFHAKRTAAHTRGVKEPKHSRDRTTEGDAWARTVGGALPRRRPA